MALFKLMNGSASRLPNNKIDGYIWVTYDENDVLHMYIDYKNDNDELVRGILSAEFANKLRYAADGTMVEIQPEDIMLKTNLVQSDWNQNDETAPDYIKNRTHYEEIETRMLTKSISWTAQQADDYRYLAMDVVREGRSNYTINGEPAEIITVDAVIRTGYPEGELVEYEVPAYLGLESATWKFAYTTTTYSEAYADKAIYCKDSSLYDSNYEYNFTITYEDGEEGEVLVVHPLDEKYIPNTIAGRAYKDAEDNILGEIFNDYENNQAKGLHSHVENSKNSTILTDAHVEGSYNKLDELHGYTIVEYTNLDSSKIEVQIGMYSETTPTEGIEVGMSCAIYQYYPDEEAGWDRVIRGQISEVNFSTVIIDTGTKMDDAKIAPNTNSEIFGKLIVNGGTVGNDTTQLDNLGDFFTSHVEGQCNTATFNSHAEGYKNQAIGLASHAEGYNTKAIGERSHTEGYKTQATGFETHAEGLNTIASGYGSHAEGRDSRALGQYAHAENYTTTALGDNSHAEGFKTMTSGAMSHAEGNQTKAEGPYAHAEGDQTQASGVVSHAEGRGTHAAGPYQHVSGRWNIADNTSLEIVGNGTNDGARSNARTLDTQGNAWYAGVVRVGKDKKKLVDETELSGAANEFKKVIGTLSYFVKEASTNRPKQPLEFKSITIQLNSGAPEIVMEFNAPAYFYSKLPNAFIRQSKVGGNPQLIQNKVIYEDGFTYEGKEYATRIRMTFNASGGAASTYTDLAELYDSGLVFFNIIEYNGGFTAIDGYMSAEQIVDIYGNLMPRNHTVSGHPVRYTQFFEDITDRAQLVGLTSHTITYDVKEIKLADENYVNEAISNSVSDWNQNDENASDYVKNRTHYEEIENGETIVHTLDEKFIPDTIARVGQNIRIGNTTLTEEQLNKLLALIVE